MPGTRELVLVGGGHAHVQVLRALAMAPAPGVRTTVVLDRPGAVYSGMVPGFVAGQYAAHELTIDVRPLARRAGAAVVIAAATRIDPVARRIELAGRPPLAWDVAALDVGSTVAGLELPGVAEHALATRPIGRFVGAVDALLARARPRGRCRLVVVGGGAGGVELAFAFRARLGREGVPDAAITLLESGPRVLPASPEPVARTVAAALTARRIALRAGARVERIEADEDGKRVVLAGGQPIACDEVLWVAGAAPTALVAGSPLPRDEAGFVRVRPTLQVEGHDDLFAVGDCAGFVPPLPKAGVYAVRQGPVLARNLRARLAGRRLRRYRPQRDFLALLNSGDGSAIGAKWGRALAGRPVFALKDRIDRRFVERFQVLAPDGARARRFAPMAAMREVPCGGCAAKLGAAPLARALARLGAPEDDSVVLGLAAGDDAAAVAMATGELLVTSVDAFRAFTDDPWLVGRVAALHATSDLWAKGAEPRFALALVTLPEDAAERGEELLFQVLAGARAALDAERITLLGGHTLTAAKHPESSPRGSSPAKPSGSSSLAVGFAVWGDAPGRDALLRLAGLAPGDRLVLTRALGTGVLWRADMLGEARSEWIAAAVASMCRSNAGAGRAAAGCGARACTDVSGFGLAGHLAALLRASGVSARVELAALPLLPGVRDCLARGVRSTFHPENARLAAALRIDPDAAADPALDALFDPQTGGGLLFGVAPERADEALAALHAAGDREAAVIGAVTAAEPGGPLFSVALDWRR